MKMKFQNWNFFVFFVWNESLESESEPLCGSLMFIQQRIFHIPRPIYGIYIQKFSIKWFLARIFFEKCKGAREFVLNLPDTVSSIKRTIIDPQAADLVSRLLEWNPKKRPTTMEALQRWEGVKFWPLTYIDNL